MWSPRRPSLDRGCPAIGGCLVTSSINHISFRHRGVGLSIIPYPPTTQTDNSDPPAGHPNSNLKNVIPRTWSQGIELQFHSLKSLTCQLLLIPSALPFLSYFCIAPHATPSYAINWTTPNKSLGKLYGCCANHAGSLKTGIMSSWTQSTSPRPNWDLRLEEEALWLAQ